MYQLLPLLAVPSPSLLAGCGFGGFAGAGTGAGAESRCRVSGSVTNLMIGLSTLAGGGRDEGPGWGDVCSDECAVAFLLPDVLAAGVLLPDVRGVAAALARRSAAGRGSCRRCVRLDEGPELGKAAEWDACRAAWGGL